MLNSFDFIKVVNGWCKVFLSLDSNLFSITCKWQKNKWFIWIDREMLYSDVGDN